MKRFRNQHSFLSLALAMLIALFATAMVVAQVNVNAPNALKKRSNAPASQKQESKPAEKPHPQGNRAKPQSHNDGVAVAPNGSVNGTVATGVVSGYRVQVLFTSAKNGRALAQQRARKIALK